MTSMIIVCLTLKEIASLVSKVVAPIYIPVSTLKAPVIPDPRLTDFKASAILLGV